jgi:hypothetical protein
MEKWKNRKANLDRYERYKKNKGVSECIVKGEVAVKLLEIIFNVNYLIIIIMIA